VLSPAASEGDGPRRFVQGRLEDATGEVSELMPEPVLDLLEDPKADPDAGDPVHWIDPTVVSTEGLRLERRYVLARATDGRPVLWSERRRLPASVPPGFAPVFDVLDDAGARPA
jgi:hypothetical protein